MDFFDVHGGIRHLEKPDFDLSHKPTVHGGIRHLEIHAKP